MSLFDFSLINTTPNEVLQKYSEEQIYQHYWPQFQFGNACSPFRSDANPSFRIYNHRSSDWRIWWSDHKTGESGHVFQFVQKVYQLKGQRLSIPEICDKICEDLHDGEALAIQKPKEYKQAKRRNSKALGSHHYPGHTRPLWRHTGLGAVLLGTFWDFASRTGRLSRKLCRRDIPDLA
jgi:hypothetical protein